jgi:IS30 family transposase
MSMTPTDPPPKSPYRAAEKASFFAACETPPRKRWRGARELGLHPQACCCWLVEAGINHRRRGLERRAEFDRLCTTGTSRMDAARHVGVHIRTAIDWDVGMRRSNGLRLNPDDRAMGYNKEVITHENRRTRLAAIEQQLNARYLSLSERERIRDLTATGSSIRSIATAIHRSPSTVSRELRRNGTNTGTSPSQLKSGQTRRR